jgi:hypothetical protein
VVAGFGASSSECLVSFDMVALIMASVATIGVHGIGARTDRVREPRNTARGHMAARR